jgi:hypothetical protein
MPSSAFDTIRRSHPDLGAFVDAVEAQIVSILARDPKAVIDDRLLIERLHLRGKEAEKDLALVLVELVAREALETVALWQCPNGYGTAAEESTIPKLPPFLQCERCGQEHVFSAAAIDLRFVATAALLDSLRDLGGRH